MSRTGLALIGLSLLALAVASPAQQITGDYMESRSADVYVAQ